MQCCIILHNMMVEERLLNNEDVLEDEEVELVLGNMASPMWAELRRASTDPQPAAPGTIAALCELTLFYEDHSLHFETRNMFIEHLWTYLGNE